MHDNIICIPSIAWFYLYMMYVLIQTLCADNIHVFFPEASSGVNTSMINDYFQGFTGLPAGIKLFFRHLATKSNSYMGGFYVDSPIWSPKNTCGNDPMRPTVIFYQLSFKMSPLTQWSPVLRTASRAVWFRRSRRATWRRQWRHKATLHQFRGDGSGDSAKKTLILIVKHERCRY